MVVILEEIYNYRDEWIKYILESEDITCGEDKLRNRAYASRVLDKQGMLVRSDSLVVAHPKFVEIYATPDAILQRWISYFNRNNTHRDHVVLVRMLINHLTYNDKMLQEEMENTKQMMAAIFKEYGYPNDLYKTEMAYLKDPLLIGDNKQILRGYIASRNSELQTVTHELLTTDHLLITETPESFYYVSVTIPTDYIAKIKQFTDLLYAAKHDIYDMYQDLIDPVSVKKECASLTDCKSPCKYEKHRLGRSVCTYYPNT